MVTTSPFVYLFSCMGLCTLTLWTYLEFQFMPTVFVSMATRLSDLDDLKPEIMIQSEGHTLALTSSQNGPDDPEAFGSAPSHSPSWGVARKPTPDWPETQYCLEIQVIYTEDEKVIPPPTCGPGQAVLFYGWQSLGEGFGFEWGKGCCIHIVRSYSVGW